MYCGCDTSYIVSVHIQCQAVIYTLSFCRGHSPLAKQETLTPPGHLVSPLVCRGPWMSTVVLYCWCHSDSVSVLLYFTLMKLITGYVSGLETYFFSHSQTFASGFNLNSQIAVSNSQLVFPTFEQFLTLRRDICHHMAIASWGWNLVQSSPLRWQRTCWRPHSSFLRLKKYIIFSAIAVTWQDSESVLRGASTFPLLLL